MGDVANKSLDLTQLNKTSNFFQRRYSKEYVWDFISRWITCHYRVSGIYNYTHGNQSHLMWVNTYKNFLYLRLNKNVMSYIRIVNLSKTELTIVEKSVFIYLFTLSLTIGGHCVLFDWRPRKNLEKWLMMWALVG